MLIRNERVLLFGIKNTVIHINQIRRRCLMSKMKSWNDEPAIQQKEYSQEKYNKKKKRSLRVAKLSCYSGELAADVGWNSMLSLMLF